MRRIERTGQGGKPVVELVPETPAEERQLERMIREGQAESRDSLADDPPRRRKPRRRK
jgi:antitoxin (DNA-binding transcriptional repressor) of toxin-antitoxin stability system